MIPGEFSIPALSCCSVMVEFGAVREGGLSTALPFSGDDLVVVSFTIYLFITLWICGPCVMIPV